MGYYKKTIMLTNDNRDISVLELVKSDRGVFGNFKNYTKYSDDCVLGVCVDGKSVYKQNVICNRQKGYDFKINADIDLSSRIGCVLFCQDSATLQPLVWGVNGDIVGYRSQILQNIQSSNIRPNEMVRANHITTSAGNNQAPDVANNSMLDENNNTTSASGHTMSDTNNRTTNASRSAMSNEINNTTSASGQTMTDANNHALNAAAAMAAQSGQVDMNVGCRDCDDVRVSSAKLFESSDEEIEADIDQNMVGMEANFFEMIEEQIEDLFANYPREENLENLVPNSKWVRVDYDNNGKEYVVGLIYDEGTLKYVAYGVPSPSRENVPDGLEGYSQWLPLDPNNADGNGYFVMFQDANTGEGIKIK